MRKTIIGVMGPGENATEEDKKRAFELGKLIAEKGFILLSGGRNQGVMDEVSKGAKSVNGLTIGIIPTKNKADASEAVDIAIITGMGSARNFINILSSDVIIACGMEAGTASEVALALKEKRNVILLTKNEEGNIFFKNLNPDLVSVVQTPQEAIKEVNKIVFKTHHLGEPLDNLTRDDIYS